MNEKGEHNHAGDQNEISNMRLKSKVKELAKTTTDSPRLLVAKALSEGPDHMIAETQRADTLKCRVRRARQN